MYIVIEPIRILFIYIYTYITHSVLQRPSRMRCPDQCGWLRRVHAGFDVGVKASEALLGELSG